MDQNMIGLVVGLIALLVALYTFYLVNDLRKNNIKQQPADSFSSKPLQLQAYERIAILADRISLASLVSRANQQQGLDARQMQKLLIDSIKQEYEYNTSQQIYISPIAWETVKSLKDQNMLIINQMASTLPEGASGTDLNRRLLEFAMTQKKGMLHEVVLEALNFEAKKVMK